MCSTETLGVHASTVGKLAIEHQSALPRKNISKVKVEGTAKQ